MKNKLTIAVVLAALLAVKVAPAQVGDTRGHRQTAGSVSVQGQDVSFEPAVTYPAGPFPWPVAVGDFNLDGAPDLVVGNDPGVSVLLGNGDGTFQDPRRYDTGCGTVTSVAVADFNGDRIPDLVETVSGDFGSCVSVLLGYGDGNFYPIWVVYPFVEPGSLAVGDFNADGALDLVWANANSTVSVLLGNGDGTFQAAHNFDVDNPELLVVGDFNGDGAPDLAVSNYGPNGTVSVLLGNGDGTFQDPQSFGVGSFPASVAVGHFNGDGALDLAVANGASNNVSVLLGNGDGTFQAAHNFDVDNPELLVVGDFNGDGLPDLALTVYVAVSVLINNTPRR